jgi:hypothetical protein
MRALLAVALLALAGCGHAAAVGAGAVVACTQTHVCENALRIGKDIAPDVGALARDIEALARDEAPPKPAK